MSVIDKDGRDVKRLREQRLGDRVIKRVNKFLANAFLGFLAQCALPSVRMGRSLEGVLGTHITCTSYMRISRASVMGSRYLFLWWVALNLFILMHVI